MARNFHIKKKDGIWQATYRPASRFHGFMLYEETVYNLTLKGIIAKVKAIQSLPNYPIHTPYKSLTED